MRRQVAESVCVVWVPGCDYRVGGRGGLLPPPPPPPAPKQAAIRYMINRMNSYRLTDANKLHELRISKQIIANSGYDTSIVKQLRKLCYINCTTVFQSIIFYPRIL